MALRLAEQHREALAELRCLPTPKRVRARVGGHTVADSTRAQLVWEPRRIVPSYAVPRDDLAASVVPAPAAGVAPDRKVLDPGVPFAAHTCHGVPLTIEIAGRELPGAGFAPSDPDLTDYVILDFGAFDEWLEEDEPIVGHPRDPLKRIDIRESSRHVVLEVSGTVVAESTRPTLLFETYLPVRYYLPPEDVRMDLLRPSDTVTTCAYKGHAAHWSVAIDDEVIPDLAWTYHNPLDDAVRVRGLIAFYTERVDLTLDGERVARPITPWSRPSGDAPA